MALPTSALVEIEFTAGGWVNVTSDVIFADGVSINNRGKPTEFDEVGPSVLSINLYNNDGKYTPDNPVSPNFPNVVEDVRIRVTMTVNGQTSMRFFGYITSWEPDFYSDLSSINKVKVTASDNLYALANYRLRPLWIEEAKRQALQTSQYGCIYEFNGVLGSDNFSDIGALPRPNVLNYVKNNAVIVKSVNDVGSYVKSDAENLLFPGSVKLVAGKTAPFYGSYIDLKLTPGAVAHSVILKINDTSALAVGSTLTLASFWTTAAADKPIAYLIERKFSTSVTYLQITDFAGTPLAAVGINTTPDRWFQIVIKQNSVDPSKTDFGSNYKPDVISFFDALPIDFRGIDRVFLGGRASTTVPGRGYDCTDSEFAAYSTLNVSSWSGPSFATPRVAGDTATFSVERYQQFAGFTGTVSGSDSGRVLYSDVTDSDSLAICQKITKSIGSMYWARPDGSFNHRFSNSIRSNTVSFQVDLGYDDANTDLTLTRTVDTTPTKVTVEAPFGFTTLADPAARVNREINLSTFNDNSASAYAVAGKELSRSRSLRVSSVVIDLVTGNNANALTLPLFTMYPGTRFLLNNLNPTIFGYTQSEYFVVGWSEFYSPTQVTFNVDTEPADNPVTGEFDSATYSRMGTATMTATGGTALTGTNVGTLILNSGGSLPLTVDPTMYPLDLDVGGERVTITSPPASAVSPQTVTVTARGVTPTVPFAHIAGTAVDLWRSVAITF
jgi:hypothetical protein